MPAYQDSGISYDYYIVALVDVLGLSSELEKQADLPATQEERTLFVESVKRTWRLVEIIRHGFKHQFKSHMEPFEPEPARGLPPNMTSQTVKELFDIRLGFQAFGDTFVGFSKVRDSHQQPTSSAVSALVFTCTHNMLLWLSLRIPLRGAIDIGTATEIQPGELFGSAMARVHHMEQRIADYPRIVVGRELTDYLSSILDYSGTDPRMTTEKRIAQTCFDMVALDDDGTPFLDFLGPGMFEVLGNKESDMVQKGYDFVADEYERFKKDGNRKLAMRYWRLRNYYRSRMPLWGLGTDVP